jgi:hypothetical protein
MHGTNIKLYIYIYIYNPTLAYYKPKTELFVFSNITFTIAHYLIYIVIHSLRKA